MIERVKPIELTDNDTGKTYTLDFNREVVRRIERNGFSLSECEKYPSLLSDLFYYSFFMHHEREINRKRRMRFLTIWAESLMRRTAYLHGWANCIRRPMARWIQKKKGE